MVENVISSDGVAVIDEAKKEVTDVGKLVTTLIVDRVTIRKAFDNISTINETVPLSTINETVQQLMLKVEEEEAKCENDHRDLLRALQSWRGDLEKESALSSVQKVSVLLDQISLEENEITALFREVEGEAKSLKSKLSFELENLNHSHPDSRLIGTMYPSSLAGLLRVVTDWNERAKRAREHLQQAKDFIDGNYKPVSPELQNLKNVIVNMKDLVDGGERYGKYSLDDRQKILARFCEHIRAVGGSEYVIFRGDPFYSEILAFLGKKQSHWLLPVEAWEHEMHKQVKYEEALSLLRPMLPHLSTTLSLLLPTLSLIPKDMYLPYPQTYFTLLKHVELLARKVPETLTHEDKQYIILYNQLWVGFMWTGVAVRNQQGNLSIAYGAILKKESGNYGFERDYGFELKGSETLITVAVSSHSNYVPFNNLPQQLQVMWGDAVDVAASRGAAFWIPPPDDNWWPVARDFGANSWSLLSVSIDNNYGYIVASRGVNVMQKISS